MPVLYGIETRRVAGGPVPRANLFRSNSSPEPNYFTGGIIWRPAFLTMLIRGELIASCRGKYTFSVIRLVLGRPKPVDACR